MTISTATRLPSSLELPATQNTAPIHEHSCLYTHDIRRKNAKRWQDGVLRFHTFNKRLMLYDVPRNFIGDTHWQEGETVEDGDEVTLEKAGVLVQVAERITTSQADLSGLWEHRKEKEKRASGALPSNTLSAVAVRSSAPRPRQGTLLPRDPNATPKTPRPVASRAILPAKSPFEQRQERLNVPNVQDDERMREEGRPSKRPRNDENHVPLWQLLRTSRPPQKPAQLETPVTPKEHHQTITPESGRRVGGENTAKKPTSTKRKQGTLPMRELVDLTTSSSQNDTLAPQPNISKPISAAPSLRKCNTSAGNPAEKPEHAASFPTLRANNSQDRDKRTTTDFVNSNNAERGSIAHRDSTAPHNARVRNTETTLQAPVKPAKPRAKPAGRLQQISLPNPSTPVTRRPVMPPSSPPVSTKNHLQPVNSSAAEYPSRDRSPELVPPGRNKPRPGQSETKTLRVMSRPQRKMLSCLESLQPATNKSNSEVASNKRKTQDPCPTLAIQDAAGDRPAKKAKRKPGDSPTTEEQSPNVEAPPLRDKGRKTNAEEPILLDSSPAFQTQHVRTEDVEARRRSSSKMIKEVDNLATKTRGRTTSSTDLPPHVRLDAELLEATAKRPNQVTRTAADVDLDHRWHGQPAKTKQAERQKDHAKQTSESRSTKVTRVAEESNSKGKQQASNAKTEYASFDHVQDPAQAQPALPAYKHPQSASTVAQETSHPARSPLRKAASIANGQGAADERVDGIDPAVLTKPSGGKNNLARKATNPQPKPRIMQSLRRSATILGPSDPKLSRSKDQFARSKPQNNHPATKGNNKPPPEPLLPEQPETEKGPWTCEAFDLFGDEMAKLREQKTGRKVDWLEKYTSSTVTAGGMDLEPSEMSVSSGFKSAAEMVAAAAG